MAGALPKNHSKATNQEPFGFVFNGVRQDFILPTGLNVARTFEIQVVLPEGLATRLQLTISDGLDMFNIKRLHVQVKGCFYLTQINAPFPG